MDTFNDIGIDNKLDWNRIRHLMVIGLFSGFLVLIGDMLIGWGVSNSNLSGMEKFYSYYSSITDSRIFWSSLLGFIGIPLEGICYFSIYRLISPYSNKYAHMFRSGVLGYIAFGGCGVHVPCIVLAFLYKYASEVSPDTSVNITNKFLTFFLLPGAIVFSIFLLVQSIAHILAFSKGLTPYPKWCWIFSLPVGMFGTILIKFIDLIKEYAFINSFTTGWISIGNIWMFGGLLLFMNKV